MAPTEPAGPGCLAPLAAGGAVPMPRGRLAIHGPKNLKTGLKWVDPGLVFPNHIPKMVKYKNVVIDATTERLAPNNWGYKMTITH